MTTLRSKLIRLAHQHPEFRADLVPLLKEAAKKPPAKLKDKKLDKLISSTYSEHGHGVTIDLMSIPKIYREAKAAYEAAETVEAAEAALVAAIKAALVKYKV